MILAGGSAKNTKNLLRIRFERRKSSENPGYFVLKLSAQCRKSTTFATDS